MGEQFLKDCCSWKESDWRKVRGESSGEEELLHTDCNPHALTATPLHCLGGGGEVEELGMKG